MKKILLAIIYSGFYISLIQAQSNINPSGALPLSTEIAILAKNIVLNKDATDVGVRPGDTFKISFLIKSETENIKNFVPMIDISELSKVADIITMETGKIQGDKVVFPPYSARAPCEESFDIIAKIKLCNVHNLNRFNIGGISIPVACDLQALPQKKITQGKASAPKSGASSLFVFGLCSIVILFLLFGGFNIWKNN